MSSNRSALTRNSKIPGINPIETLNKVGSAVKTQAKEDSKAMMQEFWKQLLGKNETVSNIAQQGIMTAGKEVFLSQKHDQLQQEARPAIRAAYNYTEEIRNIGKKDKKEQQEMQQKLHEMIGELQRIAVASVVLEKEVMEATGQAIVSPGKYHLNFFEWLLIEIRQARVKVEDASSWLVTVKGKQGKKQKTDYWNMYKKHGTKFGLSGERSVSTQTA